MPGLFLDERAVNERARALIERLELRLDPRRRVGTLTVGRQQMAEIAKALSYDAEVRVLHGLIRRVSRSRRRVRGVRRVRRVRRVRYVRHVRREHGRVGQAMSDGTMGGPPKVSGHDVCGAHGPS